MSARRTDPGPLPRIGRAIAAPLVSGAVGAVVFLIMVQGAFRQGHTTLDFNHVLGTVIQGEAEEVGSTQEALGVIGDTAGPTGLNATLLAGIALMAVHELVTTRLLRRHWLVQAVPLWILTVLALGLVYAPVADARLDTPIGVLGADNGAMTPVVLILSALGFALIAARCYDLLSRASFWRSRGESIEDALAEMPGVGAAGSLELAEEHREEGGVRP
ncbi:hypothetical protein [Miltoncostaea marina]|uniref:hypothetical protein n=1 Tax=Miltoncostaea marina TaxID=2843215 RepID=UPI001C3DF8FE|nr:hypothetical protein [Miltoncostaea marina]